MARRGHGAGTVKRRADGRWEGQLRLADGTRRYVYAADQRQLVSKLQEKRWRIASGIPRRATGLNLGTYLPEWLEVCRGRLRPKTFDSYALCVARLQPQLGRVPLVRLNPLIIQSAYARLEADGLSAQTVFQTHVECSIGLSTRHGIGAWSSQTRLNWWLCRALTKRRCRHCRRPSSPGCWKRAMECGGTHCGWCLERPAFESGRRSG